MKYENLLQVVGREPLFNTGLLFAGRVNTGDIQRQLSRWTKAGKIHKLKKELYCLAKPFEQTRPHPFLISNMLVQGSYLSNESALAFYNLIPEHTQTITAVGICRPKTMVNVYGSFSFQHIKQSLLFGYQQLEVAPNQKVFIATIEKALLDLIYLRKNSASKHFLSELRLQNLEKINLELLKDFATRFKSPKIATAVKLLTELIKAEKEEYKIL